MMQPIFALSIQVIVSAVIIASILVIPTTGKSIAQQIDCKSNEMSNAEYQVCLYKSYQIANRRLNQVYKKLIGKISGNERKELIKAQRTWVQFRDSNCSFEVYASRGGTGYSGFLDQCLERMTRQRTADLSIIQNKLSRRTGGTPILQYDWIFFTLIVEISKYKLLSKYS
jgi:uncharacterized protein YecT (DUF1311 family)